MCLSFEAQKSRFRSLDEWFRSSQGIHITDFFAAELAHMKDLLHGELLLQLGGNPKWLQSLHYTHKWCTTPYLNPHSTLIASFNQLPLDRDSVDCVVSPLVLEAFKSQSPIDEIDRVLKPTGYVIFWGINPYSLWGLFVRLRKLSCYGPLAAQPKSIYSLKRAMIQRGYIQCYFSSFYYIPPLITKKWLNRMNFLNEMGKMLSPCPVGFYCLVMQKQEEIHSDYLFNEAEKNASWKKIPAFAPVCQIELENKFE